MVASTRDASVDRFSLVRAHGQHDDFAHDVRLGLTASPKTLPPKYFYDDLGSMLFEAICRLPEYYVSRSEGEILGSFADEIVQSFGTPVRLIELGSGTSRKTRVLLDKLIQRQRALEYIPIDIDGELLHQTAQRLLEDYSDLFVHAVVADFRRIDDVLPPLLATGSQQRNVVLFLGSTIGNLDRGDQKELLRTVRRVLFPGDMLLIGADQRKRKDILEPAYSDALGVTAAFNLNLLVRMNSELGAQFNLNNFRHRAFFNEEEGRIEMHIVSSVSQSVRIEALDIEIIFASGETIHTENSYKFDDAEIAALAGETGFAVERSWTDSRRFFADVLLVAQTAVRRTGDSV